MLPAFIEFSDRDPSAIAENDPKSSPAQNDCPSPDSTTARSPSSVLRCSPIAAIDVNIALSSALRLSARFRRTSATPFFSVIVTRSSITPAMPIAAPLCRIGCAHSDMAHWES